MSPGARSEEDALEFDHLKEPACEGRRKACSHVHRFKLRLCIWRAHSHGPDTDTPPSEIRASSQQERDREALLLNLPALCYLLLTPFGLAPGQRGAMHLTREIRDGAVVCSPEVLRGFMVF